MHIAAKSYFITNQSVWYWWQFRILFKDEECSTLYEEEPRIYGGFRPLYLRLITIFVYTEVVVRTIDSATSYNAHDIANRSSNRDVLPMLTGIKVWRIIQLLTVTITYLYRLFKQADWKMRCALQSVIGAPWGLRLNNHHMLPLLWTLTIFSFDISMTIILFKTVTNLGMVEWSHVYIVCVVCLLWLFQKSSLLLGDL